VAEEQGHSGLLMTQQRAAVGVEASGEQADVVCRCHGQGKHGRLRRDCGRLGEAQAPVVAGKPVEKVYDCFERGVGPTVGFVDMDGEAQVANDGRSSGLTCPISHVRARYDPEEIFRDWGDRPEFAQIPSESRPQAVGRSDNGRPGATVFGGS
jgi:hypothetical protein